MKMSLLVDNEKAQSLPFKICFMQIGRVLVKPGIKWKEWTECPGKLCTLVWQLKFVFQLFVALILCPTSYKFVDG